MIREDKTSIERYWQFRELSAVEEPVFDGVLEKFYNLGGAALVRENLQNSLDGKLPDFQGPVEVSIETGTLDIEKIPGIREIRERIFCLKGGNAYTKRTITEMERHIDKVHVPYISFEDKHTKGLSGAFHGEKSKPEDTWAVYAYKKGVHFFETDQKAENVRGGSHGVGKIASNAASGLYLMYFANCDADGNQHLGGTVQLIEHVFNGQCYRATGFFSDTDEEGNLYPFENHFDSVFEKNTRGLKIIIPFLREQFCDEKMILRSVCDNFFVAILTGGLTVRINETLIDKNSIIDIVKNGEIYREQEEGEFRDNFTPLYVRTFLEQKPGLIRIADKQKDHRFRLYFYYSQSIKKGRLAIVRRIGMKIEDKKIKNYANAPFNGILIPESDEEDLFLKTMENESHTELSDKHIKDPEEQKNALRFINNISRRIGETIADILRKENPSDGKIDTSDLLYSMEASFRKELAKSIATVKLTKSNRSSERLLVKVKTGTRTNKAGNSPQKNTTTKKNSNRRTRKKDGTGSLKPRVRYSMNPENIRRLVLDDKEVLQLSFDGNSQYDGERLCDISLAVVDGMGKEYETELDVNKGYPVILDKNTGNICTVSNNIIKNVSIKDKQIDLEMTMSDQFNRSLKFIYYVEV